MKFLFILLIPFLVSINFISNKTEKSDRVKCCDFIAETKPEYLEEGYTKSYSMRVDMSYHWKEETKNYKRRDTIRYTMVREEGDNIKLITQFQYSETIDNLSVTIEDVWRKSLPIQTRKINEKQTELKVRIPKKGLYYICFIGKDFEENKAYCGSSLFFIRQESRKEIKENRKTNENQIHKK